MDAEPVEEADGVGSKAFADSHIRDGVFEDRSQPMIQAIELAHGRVGVGVGECRRLGS